MSGTGQHLGGLFSNVSWNQGIATLSYLGDCESLLLTGSWDLLA